MQEANSFLIYLLGCLFKRELGMHIKKNVISEEASIAFLLMFVTHSPYKTICRTLITSFYKELLDYLTK